MSYTTFEKFGCRNICMKLLVFLYLRRFYLWVWLILMSVAFMLIHTKSVIFTFLAEYTWGCIGSQPYTAGFFFSLSEVLNLLKATRRIILQLAPCLFLLQNDSVIVTEDMPVISVNLTELELNSIICSYENCIVVLMCNKLT